MRDLKRPFVLLCLGLVLSLSVQTARGQSAASQPWSKEKADAWYQAQGWLVGSNFAPSTAINQLEMWQADTFDPETIDRELGWAEQLGFNTMRVFLHNLLWEQDPQGFVDRIDQFLTIADRHGIRPMFVLFDSVWDPFPHLGKQRAPKPHIHNSGWVQSPGVAIISDTSRYDELEGYVKGVIGRFRNDDRVALWDMFNEPDNDNRPAYYVFEPNNKGELALILLKKAYGWAREVDPSQPITSAPWHGDWSDPDHLSPMDDFMLHNSDVITFHSYNDLETVKQQVAALKQYGRPLICTEYMARPTGSTFQAILPFFKEQNVGAYNWGFVSGKTQTIYPWDSWYKEYSAEPALWFHDIFRKNGAPYDPKEVQLIKSLTGKR
ncbi:MAG TPA: glycoside hydrolase family 2 TIM barrel-domain containing protein [Rhodothermales bacterium]|nr:glycoside hydrolase family 2 TIM barrel-domain containing protein [Rhodothermales bacterium]